MQDNQKNTQRIARNTLFMFIRMILVMCVGFFTSRVVLDVLGEDDYGIYNIVGSVVVFLSFFKNALNNATYRFLTFALGKGDKERLWKTFSMAINTHVILAVSLWIILELVGVWFLNNKLNIPTDRMYAANWVFQLSLLTFVVEVIKTPFNSSIISHEQMSFYAYTSIVEVVLKLGIVYILLIGNVDKLILYAFLILFVTVVMFFWYVIYCYKNFQETHYRFYWDPQLLQGFVSYSGWSLLVNGADVTVQQSINIFFNLFNGVAANAAMGIANQVNSILNNFLSSFTTSFNPQIIKSYAQNDLTYFMGLILSTSKISYFLLFGIAFPIMVNIDFLLEVWLVNPPQMSGTFLCFILVYSLIDAISAPLWNAVHATGNIRIHQILMSSIKVLNIPIGYMLLKNGFPLYSAVALYVGLNMVCCVVRAIYMHYLIHLSLRDYFIGVLLRVLFVTAIVVPLPLYYSMHHTQGWEHLFISSLLFVLPYLFVVYAVGLSKKEKQLFSQMILSRIPLFHKKHEQRS